MAGSSSMQSAIVCRRRVPCPILRWQGSRKSCLGQPVRRRFIHLKCVIDVRRRGSRAMTRQAPFLQEAVKPWLSARIICHSRRRLRLKEGAPYQQFNSSGQLATINSATISR